MALDILQVRELCLYSVTHMRREQVTGSRAVYYGIRRTGLRQTHMPYFRDQTPPSISSRPRIIAAPPEVLNEIVAALE